ncbi:MAG: ATP-binding protein [bacterium]
MTDLNRFSRLAPYLVTKTMKLSGASVMVYDRDSHKYIVRAGEREAHDLEGLTVDGNSQLVEELLAKRKEIVASEIAKTKPRVAAEMRRLKADLIIPSISESQYFQKPTLLSTLNLGSKVSGKPFNKDDIEFLSTLANQASISIECAFIFEELKKSQAQVVRSEKLAAIGTATAGVAHELRNPLTYLSTLAQILPKKYTDPDFMKSVVDILPSETEHMQMIVEGLLDYSRNRELSLKPIDVKDVIEKTMALLGYELRHHKVEIKTDYRHRSQAKADPNRLIQVFMNLITNAVQAMGDNGGNLSIATNDNQGDVVIAFTDTGPGIPEDKVKNIFDPFFTTKETGTGLGLAISKKIIDEHHGSIVVESRVGLGTTFRVGLPQAN